MAIQMDVTEETLLELMNGYIKTTLQMKPAQSINQEVGTMVKTVVLCKCAEIANPVRPAMFQQNTTHMA
jgi:hypothetical protein